MRFLNKIDDMTSDSVVLPNIFNHATSELSQDAILAYILSWAKPEFRDSHPKLNEIGEALLTQMIKAAVRGTNAASFDPLPIVRLEVGTQRDNMDVWAEINDEFFLIIEDKTTSFEHSKQIQRYIDRASRRGNSLEERWKHIHAIYTKTGNESKKSKPENGLCGVFMRSDILRAISQADACGNTLIEDFAAHLRGWEIDTESYKVDPAIKKWSWRAREGFYMELEGWLYQLSSEPCDAGWGSVPRRSGGFLGLWWHWRSLESERCKLYLQVEDGWRLQIRVSDVKNDQGHPEKSNASLLHRVRSKINDAAKSETFKAMKVNKSGRYRGGNHSAVVDITFDDSDQTYIAVNQGGTIDMPRTKERLGLAMKLVDIVCNVDDT